MSQPSTTDFAPMCPSAQPEMAGASVFGVVRGSAKEPRVAYLDRTVVVTPEVVALAGPVHPAEVFRVGAPCAATGCVHFGGGRCQLARRLVRALPEVVSVVPSCAIRGTCMWRRQEGAAACKRCPQVVTRMHGATEVLREAAAPGPV